MIIKALIETEISNVKKLSTKVLLDKIRNIDNKANNANINKVTTFESPKKELSI